MTHNASHIPDPTTDALPDALPDADPIPPIDTADLPFHDADELRQRWRALMGPLGFGEPMLWLLFVERDSHLIKAINKLPLPTTPDPELIDLLMHRFGETLENTIGMSVACLLSRPGADGITPRDRGWAILLTECAARHGVRLQPLFRANDINVVGLEVHHRSTADHRPLNEAS
ncbi:MULTISPECIES: hypothetical protein [unclassified Gordonia (in: high G+C Gram-positive bacteria)]